MKPLTHEDEKLWSQQASQLSWFKKWEKILEWKEPFAQWFLGGELNASHVCLDVHMQTPQKNKNALLWEDELGNKRQLTYEQLYLLTNKIASSLKKLGVAKGDVVVVYAPMLPETIAAMLAIVRLGAMHCVVFSGFGVDALRDRIIEVGAKVVITADFGIRRGRYLPLKEIVDAAICEQNIVKTVVVIKRTDRVCPMMDERDYFLHALLTSAENYIKPLAVESSHPLFVLYTSGSTGKPKGIVHATGGYLTYVYSTIQWAFDISDSSIYWCTADIGWITGHSYVVYGPLMHGATLFIYEGAPDFPSPDIWWRLIERYGVTIFYTAPTALRFFMRCGDEWVKGHNLSSLKVLGSVGEPINPQVWQWFYDRIGCARCPIIDTWWQTETGGFMIAPTAGRKLVPLIPGSATLALPGIEPEVVDEHGDEVLVGKKGFLVINKPWPGMTIGFFRDQELFKKLYWERFSGKYFSGDYAIKDTDGYFWLLGRADEVLNIAGHRIGTAEVETAVIGHPAVAEAAAIGVEDTVKGENIIVFAVLRQGFAEYDNLMTEIIACVHSHIGRFVTPKQVYFVSKLPKTRSGKIMRRVLKAMINNKPLGDVTTMEDEGVMHEVREIYNNFQHMYAREK